MDKKVAYLFGAGASAMALPLVKDIPDRLKKFKEEVIKELGTKWIPNKFVQMLDELHDDVIAHSTIDTYAKKLFVLKKKEKLNFLKSILTLFFVWEQTKKTDSRYDSFIASIIENNGEFSDRIKILSWNYDYQFEKSYNEYFNEKIIEKIQRKLNVYPSPVYPDLNSINMNSFSLTKLNGTLAFHRRNEPADRSYKMAENFVDNISGTSKDSLF